MCVYEERHDVKIARHIAEVPNNQKIKDEHGTCDLCILEKTMCKQLDIPNLSPDTHTYTNKPTPARCSTEQHITTQHSNLPHCTQLHCTASVCHSVVTSLHIPLNARVASLASDFDDL